MLRTAASQSRALTAAAAIAAFLVAAAAASAQEATEYGVGFNWYLNRFVKLVTDYEHTNFRMVPGNKSPFRDENVLMSRVQLAF